jgi:hypothetical protein
VKLMWVLGNAKDAGRATALLQQDLAGECTPRSYHGL